MERMNVSSSALEPANWSGAMRVVMQSVLLIAVFTVSAWPVGAAEESPADAVDQYVIPGYNGMYPGTEVVFKVVVDANGDVASVESVSVVPPAPVLPTLAGDAIRQWKFKQSNDPPLREFEVRVVFEGAVSTENPGAQATLEPPLTFRLFCITANVALLERVAGVVPRETCSLHGVPMDVTRVPNRYRRHQFGHPSYSDIEIRQMNRYDRAKDRLFPNAPIDAFVVCDAPSRSEGQKACEEYVEVRFCPLCVEARTIWCTKHAKACPGR